MDSEGRRRGVDGDDSLLASVAGVPLTRMTRIAVCVIWAGFWAARVLLTDAMMHISPLDAKLLLSELVGPGPVDQAFSICMVWLTVEVAVIARIIIGTGVEMLIAKTPKSWTEHILRGLPLERLKAEVERRERSEPDNGSGPQNGGKQD